MSLHQDLRAEVWRCVRSEVTVGYRIAEIESLVVRYCCQDLPSRIRLPSPSPQSLSSSASGILFYIDSPSRGQVFVLSECGAQVGSIKIKSAIEWVVFNPVSRCLLALVNERIIRLNAAGAEKTAIAEYPYSERPSVHAITGNMLLVEYLSTAYYLLDPHCNRLSEVSRPYAKVYFEVDDVGIVLYESHSGVLYAIGGGAGSKRNDLWSRYLHSFAHVYDPISRTIVSIDYDHFDHLHFTDPLDFTRRTVKVDVGSVRSELDLHFWICRRDDGRVLLYIQNRAALFIFDLCQLVLNSR